MTVRLNASAADEPRCTLILSRLLTLSRTLYPIVVQLLETYVDLYDAEAAKRYGGMLDRQVESSQRCLRLNVWHDVVGGANEEAYAEVLRIISMLPQLRWLSVPPSPAMVDVVSRCQDLRTYIYTVQSGTKKHHDCPSLSNAVHLSSRLAARLPQLRHLLLTAQRHHPVTLVSGPSSDYTTLRSLALHVSHLTIPDLYTAARSFPLSLVTLKLVVYSLGNSVSMPTDTEITLAQALEPITAQLRHLEFLIDPPDLQMRPRFQLDPLIPHLTSLKMCVPSPPPSLTQFLMRSRGHRLRVQGLFISREALLPLLPSLCALSLRSSSALHLADVRSLLEDTTNDLRALSAVGSPYEKRPPREVAALRVRDPLSFFRGMCS